MIGVPEQDSVVELEIDQVLGGNATNSLESDSKIHHMADIQYQTAVLDT